MTTGAHNVLLELWMNVGLFGVAAYFTAMIISTIGAERMEWTDYLFSAAYILWFMVFGWTERSMSLMNIRLCFYLSQWDLPAINKGRAKEETIC